MLLLQNYHSPEEIVNEAEQNTKHQTLTMLQQQLEQISQVCQALLSDQQNGGQANNSLSSSGLKIYFVIQVFLLKNTYCTDILVTDFKKCIQCNVMYTHLNINDVNNNVAD